MPENTNKNGLKVGLPWGLALEATGRDVVLALIIILCAVGIAWTNYLVYETMQRQTQVIFREHDARQAEHGDMIRSTKMLIYILSLPQERRPEIIPPDDLDQWIKQRRRLPDGGG